MPLFSDPEYVGNLGTSKIEMGEGEGEGKGERDGNEIQIGGGSRSLRSAMKRSLYENKFQSTSSFFLRGSENENEIMYKRRKFMTLKIPWRG